MRNIYMILILLLLAKESRSATIRSTAVGGVWSTASTWENGVVPVSTDNVIILNTATVTSNTATITCAGIEIAGTLTFGSGSFIVNGNLLIDVGGSFRPTGIAFAINGNFVNNGSANLSALSTVMRMGTPTPVAATSISGTGEFTTGVVRTLRCDNTGGIALAVPLSICAELGLWRGTFNSNGNITLDNTVAGNGTVAASVKLTRQQTASIVGSYALGTTASLTLEYSRYTALPNQSITTGNEIPTSRQAYALIVNNPGGIVIDDDLSLSSATPLTLTSGIATVAPGKTIVCASELYAGITGSASSFIDGGVALTASTAASDKTYPVGSLGQNRAVTITGLSSASATASVRFAVISSSGGDNNQGLTISTTRRWLGSLLTGNMGSYSRLEMAYGTDDAVTAPLSIAHSATIDGVYSSFGIGNSTPSTVATPIGSYTDLGYFALASGMGTLPVSLLEFDARYLNNTVKITWSTAAEKNNDRFEVERLVEGRGFVTVVTQKGKVNSTDITYYSVNDYRPVPGINYYRIKQVDKDGTITMLSDAVAVKVPKIADAKLSIYGKSDILNIVVTDNTIDHLEVIISDLNGRLVHHNTLANPMGDHLFQTKLSQPLKGLYVVKVKGMDFSKTAKVIF
ncbi:T9SS type A sorting domain-containing protein [Pedobacter sp.]